LLCRVGYATDHHKLKPVVLGTSSKLERCGLAFAQYSALSLQCCLIKVHRLFKRNFMYYLYICKVGEGNKEYENFSIQSLFELYEVQNLCWEHTKGKKSTL